MTWLLDNERFSMVTFAAFQRETNVLTANVFLTSMENKRQNTVAFFSRLFN